MLSREGARGWDVDMCSAAVGDILDWEVGSRGATLLGRPRGQLVDKGLVATLGLMGSSKIMTLRRRQKGASHRSGENGGDACSSSFSSFLFATSSSFFFSSCYQPK